MERFRDRWKQHEGGQGWTYDERKMEEELFEHRFGKRPTLEMIAESIPVMEEDKIPDDGRLSSGGNSSMCSASETEAVIIDDESDRRVVCGLYELSPGGFRDGKFSAGRAADGDIRATWDSANRKGVRF